MAGLKTIYIYTEDIYPGMKYMRDNQDRLDLIGQILYSGYGIKIHNTVKHRHTKTQLFPPSQRAFEVEPITPLSQCRFFVTLGQ